MPKKQTGRAAEQSVPKKQAKKGARANRPKDPVKTKAGKASAAARRANREKGDPIARACSARRTNGEPCKNSAIRGGTVCSRHGGSAPQVREAANRRLVEMVLPAMKELHKILHKPDVADADKLRAIQMVLNRTGYNEKHTIDIGLREPTPFDDLQVTAFTIKRGPGTLSSPTPSSGELPSGGGGDDALDELLDRRDRDREHEAKSRIANEGHDVVPGAVVSPDEANLFGFERTRAQKLRESGQPTEHDPDPHRPDGEPFAAYEAEVRRGVEGRK